MLYSFVYVVVPFLLEVLIVRGRSRPGFARKSWPCVISSRYVVDELERARCEVHLAEAADLSKGRGPKQQAKTDAADARHLRELLQQERVPESWIPPTEVLARLIDGSKNRHWLNHDRQAAEPS